MAPLETNPAVMADQNKPVQQDNAPGVQQNQANASLIDTGATINAISAKLVNSHHLLKQKLTPLPSTTRRVATACDKSKITLTGIIEVEILIFDRAFTTKLHVADNLQDHVILGVPFLKQAQMLIAYDAQGMYVTFNSTLKLKGVEQLPPMSEKLVIASLDCKLRRKQNLLSCGNLHGRFSESVTGGRTLISADSSTTEY